MNIGDKFAVKFCTSVTSVAVQWVGVLYSYVVGILNMSIIYISTYLHNIFLYISTYLCECIPMYL